MNKITSFLGEHKLFFIFLGIMAILLVVFDLFFFHSMIGSFRGFVYSDGEGYYSYLPAVFIHHDIFMNFADKIPGCHSDAIDFNILPDGRLFNKYPVGIAILQFPFFITTHFFVSLLRSFPADGYSLPYQISVAVGCFVYWALGMFFLYRIIEEKFSKKIGLITCIIFALCTNFINYLTLYASMGHTYSFFLISLFIYLVLKEDNFKNKPLYSLFLGIISGILFLVKSINISVLLIYILYKAVDKETFIKRMKEIFSLSRLPFNFIGLILPLSLQVAYWYKVCGKFYLNTYYNETFYWLNPKFLLVLFGSTKGLFFYIPILLVCLIGLWVYKKHFREIFWGSLGFLLVVFYMVSIWWTGWFQADSFGSRMFVDYYPLLMLFFACALNYILQNKLYTKIFVVFCIICFCFTNFMYFMYLTKALPEESGLNTYKDLFSFKLINGKYFARVGEFNNKKYLLQEAFYCLPYIVYPKGHYRVKIEGDNLLTGKFPLMADHDIIENYREEVFNDKELSYQFDFTQQTDALWFFPSIPENKKIKPENIWVERTPDRFEIYPEIIIPHFSYNEKIFEREISSADEYEITVKGENLDKLEFLALVNDKKIRIYDKTIIKNEAKFTVKINDNDVDFCLYVNNDFSDITARVDFVEVKEKNGFNLWIGFEKFRTMYPNTNPYNWYDTARLR